MIRSLLLVVFSFLGIITFSQTSLNPCAQAKTIHVVVLGSSTAAGSGPSSSDSAWVNRYRKYLQSVNPSNTVTNLAIGGTTTYHIMPTWFVPPIGRPNSNPNNNISRAITLNADAIIINMPSNDAANGFGIIEQMHNFITIDKTADSSGIPVWVCTTQPRNGFNAAKKLIQIGVRDSVLSYFGQFAIDFWTGFASANNDLLSIFDSGDGVHMNDTAHNLLNKIVIAKKIPNALIDTPMYVDHKLQSLTIENSSQCGDSSTNLLARLVNIGQSASNLVSVNFRITDLSTNLFTDSIVSIKSPMLACSEDTVSLIINTYFGVNLDIQAYVLSQDSIKNNDSSSIINLKTLGHPEIQGVNDTVCIGDIGSLHASITLNTDSVLWYDSLTGGKLIGIGQTITLDSVVANKTFYASAVRGGLTYRNSLFTSTFTTTNWNGIMFDIVASDTLTLDSLSCKLNTLGSQNVIAYRKTGSYIGHEMNASSWQSWGNVSVSVAQAGDLVNLNYPDITLHPSDTLGVYLHLQNTASTLSYRSSSQPISYTNSEIQILRGSGIAHTFGATYFPRNFSGELFYHFGFNEEGDCSTPRIPISAIVSEPSVYLGKDTTIHWNASINLTSDKNFDSYLWSDNSTNKSLLVDSNNYFLGPNLIWLEVMDDYSCMATDTITVNFSLFSTVEENQSPHSIIFPNPFKDVLIIQLSEQYTEIQIRVTNLSGQVVFSEQKSNLRTVDIDLSQLIPGVYFVSVITEKGFSKAKIVKQ